eukprot:GHRQ01034206.1.p1 GENE.GHRQ01034206.1~~GHRQ01034206.1.p1  ORF type:complete len:136 (+),score=24.64 GHRQ01034206.1:31-408(+)
MLACCAVVCSLQTVHSLDLVATAPGAIACNMAATPLAAGSCDAAVFSLALMGLDYGAFLVEAARVLKQNGWLWIAEVSRSRKFVTQPADLHSGGLTHERCWVIVLLVGMAAVWCSCLIWIMRGES